MSFSVNIINPADQATVSGIIQVDTDITNQISPTIEPITSNILINGVNWGTVDTFAVFGVPIDTGAYFSTATFMTIEIDTTQSGEEKTASITIFKPIVNYDWMWDIMEDVYPMVAKTFRLYTDKTRTTIVPFDDGTLNSVKPWSIANGYTSEVMYNIFQTNVLRTNTAHKNYNTMTFDVFQFAYPVIQHFSLLSLPATFEKFIADWFPVTVDNAYDVYISQYLYPYTGIPNTTVLNNVLSLTGALNLYLTHDTINLPIDSSKANTYVNQHTTSGLHVTFNISTFSTIMLQWSTSATTGFSQDNVVLTQASPPNEIYADGNWNSYNQLPTGTLYIMVLNGNGYQIYQVPMNFNGTPTVIVTKP